MTAIARHRLDRGPVDRRFWPALAAACMQWLAPTKRPLRDCIVLLPHAGLLPSARAAFAGLGGWQPRIETPSTLAATLGPAPQARGGAPCGEASTDRLAAAALLRSQGFGSAWAERDPRAFDAAVVLLAEFAQRLQRAEAQRPPDERAAWWAGMREALPPLAGAGATERLLARIALEWAAGAPAPATDALWRLRPAAWIGLRAGGDDPFMERLLEQAAAVDVPVLWLDADPPLDQPFDAAASLPAPARACAEGLEDEASAAALALVEALDHGLAPVALIAQDRLVVRRIRALLERAGIALADETGWTLSTTRAAAHVMALLKAAAPGAGRDALIEALKGEAPEAAAALEDAWRRERSPSALALAAEQALCERLATLRGSARRRLAAWVPALRSASPALMAALAADPAGREVLAVLHLDGAPDGAAWRAAAQATPLDLPAFTAWVDTTLEASSFVPPADDQAPVLITPLARAALRPFGAVVFPGCDERHLGASAAQATLIPEAVARAFGLADAGSRREHETLAFAQLLRAPNLHLLRRSHDGDAPLAPSPLLELAWHARRRAGRPEPDELAVRLPIARVERRPLERPAPSMPNALPARLSASAVEALRACPYRFFARVALGLGESNELDDALDKSDHGRWLHAVLHRFHSARDGIDDRAQLLAAADAVQAELGLDAAAHWPFRAAFDTVADHYLAWLHAHDQQGWRFAGGELERRCTPPDLDGLTLDGRLDRIDLAGAGVGGASGAMLIDYKTGNAAKLAKLVRMPLEDTQLAFYATLLTDEPQEPAPRAIYLAIGERGPPREIEHPDVALSAAQLVEGLATDLAALRGGAGAPALGEGEACEFCHARGLCRRDHWRAG
jgi:ATP-dependent helicase/nuclease subunit B